MTVPVGQVCRKVGHVDAGRIGVGLAIVGGLGALGGGALAGLQAAVRKTVYPRPRPATPVEPPPGFELLRSPGGIPVLFSPPSADHPTIAYLHGNAEELGSMLERVLGWHGAGFGVAAIEYPGYGPDSTGGPTERRIVAGCEDALTFVSARPDVDEVVLLGYSLGSAFAIDLAHRGYGQKLVVAAGFTSAADICRQVVPHIPARIFLGRERLDNLTKARRVGIPTVVIHGTADEQIPIEMGRRLANALPHSQFVARKGVDHNGLGDHLLDAVRIVCETDRGTSGGPERDHVV